MNKSEIRVRFAPSPTGTPHLGNIRTALVNYIFARKNNGKFLLRIEDTDQERSNAVYVDKILDTLNILGMKHDEEIIYQSKRKDIYQTFADDLIAKGFAYKEFNEDGTYAIKLKINYNDEKLSFNDSIRGKIERDIKEINDLVLIKSDGFPAYMFAVVVDDHDMKITHVIRGDDHLINTFKQNYIYKALGWHHPHYTHLPMILSQGGKKLSKRNDSVNLEEYLGDGFLPESLINYLLMLGWSYERVQKNTDQFVSEIFSLDEAIQMFDLVDLRKSPSKFDKNKLLDMNAKYILTSDFHTYFHNAKIYKFLNKDDIQVINDIQLCKNHEPILLEIKKRSKTLQDLISGIKRFILLQNINNNNVMSLDCFEQYLSVIKNEDIWTHENLELITRDFCNNNNVKMRELMGFIRMQLFSINISPSIFLIMSFFGKQKFFEALSLSSSLKS